VKNEKKPTNVSKTTSIRGLEDEFSIPTFRRGIDKKLFTDRQDVNVETLYRIVRTSPEVTASLMAIDEDIMADEWRFDGGKKNIKEIQKFSMKSNFYKVLSNAIFDLLITGNAYILKLSVNDEKIASIVKEATKVILDKLGVKQKDAKKQIFEIVEQETKKPLDLQLLKSSTMLINFDDTGKVLSYQQEVRGNTRLYRPQDVVHLSLINVGGQPYGFTPLETLFSDVATLIFAKEYAGKFFENDGIPHFIFKLLNDGPDSPNVVKLKSELKQLKKSSEKFRSMVITGELEVEQLQRFQKDLQFATLITHWTQIVLIALGVPAHRVNYTIVKDTKGQDVNRAFEGYFRKISFLQKLIENQLNKDLFSAWNSKMVFKRAYKIDEMREATIVQILTQIGAITIEEGRQMMGLDPDIPKGTMPNKTGDDNRPDFNADKRRQTGEENNPPPDDQQADNKVKNIEKSSNEVEVDFTTFRVIVEGTVPDRIFAKAKILYKETEVQIVLFFTDRDWIYRTTVNKKDIDDIQSFRTEFLRHAILIQDRVGQFI